MNNHSHKEHLCVHCCCCTNCPFQPRKHESSERRMGKQEEFAGGKKNKYSAESKMGASEEFEGSPSDKHE